MSNGQLPFFSALDNIPKSKENIAGSKIFFIPFQVQIRKGQSQPFKIVRIKSGQQGRRILQEQKIREKQSVIVCPPSPYFWTFRRPCKVDYEDFFSFAIFHNTSTDFMLLVHKIIGIFCYCFSPPPLNHNYSVIYTIFCVCLTY